MMMFQRPIVVFDVETTGLNPGFQQNIEIAAVRIGLDGTEDTFHELIALEPGSELPPFITELTGITPQHLEGKRSEAEVLESFREFAEGCIFIAQNAGFDLGFIARGHIFPEEFYCTRYMTRFLEMEKSASLKEVTKRRDIKLEGHHRAMNDVRATIEVLNTNIDLMIEQMQHLHRFKNRVLQEADRPVHFKPRHSQQEFVYKVQLTTSEISEIHSLLKDSEIKSRLSWLMNR
ncbi:MAG: 3'-5' exonuclease [Bacillota bacterium]